MIFNNVLGIWCCNCNKYYNPHTEVFLNVIYEGSITCDKDHLVGNQSDLQWEQFVGEKNDMPR